MSIEATPAAETSAPVAAKAEPKPKAKAKPAAKSAKTPKAEKTPKVRSVGETTMSTDERRRHVIKTMIKMGATSATTAKTADQIGAKAGFTRFDVYGLLYHANPLQKNGYVKQVQLEDVVGLSYHLTAKGAKGYEPKE